MRAQKVPVLGPGKPLTTIWGYAIGDLAGNVAPATTPGPTIHVERGRRVAVRHFQDLQATHPDQLYPSTTSVHPHGSGSLPQFDGYASDTTATGHFKDYHYPNHQDARTLWYHDHAGEAPRRGRLLIAMAADAITRAATPAAASAAPGRRSRLLSNRGLLVAASLSLGAGLVHLEVTNHHWFLWWGYGMFFLMCGIAQVLYAAAVVRWPTAPVLWIAIAGNLGIVGMYLYTRTNGIPWGPGSGHIGRVGTGDFITTVGEFVLAGMLIATLGPRVRSWAMTLLALAGVGLWVLRFTTTLL